MEYLLGDLNVDPSDMQQPRVVGDVTEMPEYLDIIRNTLVNCFRDGYIKYIDDEGDDDDCIAYINALLIKNQAIIAGGSLLRMINNRFNPISNDIDIYVPCKNLKDFNRPIAKLIGANSIKVTTATSYCLSFLRKNGIRSVQTLRMIDSYDERDPDNMQDLGERNRTIDIMGVRNSNSPLNVVKNFDLSFCQIWYDGNMVYATHPDHIRNKSGFLQKEYIPAYLNNNMFIKRRIQKYMRLGYEIKLETPAKIDKISDNISLKCKKLERTPEFYKKWLSRIVLHNILSSNEYTPDYNKSGPQYINSKPHRFRAINRHIIVKAQLYKDDDDMDPLHYMDGYDSEDYDITNEEQYYPLTDGYKDRDLIQQEDVQSFTEREPKSKFWLLLRKFIDKLYHVNEDYPRLFFDKFYRYVSIPSLDSDIYKVSEREMKKYYDVANQYAVRIGMDSVTFDDVPIYDMHLHNLDQGISKESLEAHLRGFIGLQDKNKVPCYVAGCTKFITLNTIISIVSKEFFLEFTAPPPLGPPMPLLGNQRLYQSLDADADQIVDLIEVLRDVPETSGGWRNVYHHVMCPFCLCYVSRDSGCMYVQHPNPEGRPASFAPYCRPENLIHKIYDKYKAIGGNSLQICAECGRPSSDHKHFSTMNEDGGVELIPIIDHLTGDYLPGRRPDECYGGKRAEGLGRIVAVNMFKNRASNYNPELQGRALHISAGIYAEEFATNSEEDMYYGIMVRAREILAKPPTERQLEDLDNVPYFPESENNNIAHGGKYKLTRKRSYIKKRKTTRKH